MMRVGWLRVDSDPERELGGDGMSYVFDGSSVSYKRKNLSCLNVEYVSDLFCST